LELGAAATPVASTTPTAPGSDSLPPTNDTIIMTEHQEISKDVIAGKKGTGYFWNIS